MGWGHGLPSVVIFNLPLKFGSKWSTLKFWVFGPRAQFLACSPIELEITLEKNSNGIWKFGNLIWSPLEEMNKTQKSFRNRRILVFQLNFCQNLVFCKNRGDFLLTQWKKDAIKYIRDIKIWNFSMKPWPSPSLANLLPSQIDDTKIRLPVIPKLISQ